MSSERFLKITMQVNGISLSPVAWFYGHMGLPAVYGFGHALQRFWNERDCNSVIESFAVASIKQKINSTTKGYHTSFSISRNPHFLRDANLNVGVPILEECKAFGIYSTIFKISNYSEIAKKITEIKLPAMRFAGGTIDKVLSIESYSCNEDGEKDLIKSLMPGTVLIDKTNNLVEYAKDKKCDYLDALLDHMTLISEEKEGVERKGKEYVYYKKANDSGWVIPVFVGYQRVSGMQKGLAGQREPEYQHCFVEPVVGMAECVLINRVKRLEDVMWHMKCDAEQNYFIFQQNHKTEKEMSNV